MKLYQPSDSDEGVYFNEIHCMRCIHCDPDPEGKKKCEILGRALYYSSDKPEYPREWRYGIVEPTCTKWKKWDWESDGDPDDLNNPNAPTPPDPIDPNQLRLLE